MKAAGPWFVSRPCPRATEVSGTDNASMVPGRFDVVLDGWGFVTARAVDPNMPFRVQQQMLSYSPTFVERQNVSNSYGDNAQDFFLTIRQRDWSLGEQQKYFRAGQDGRYWQGANIDRSVPGQVSLSRGVSSASFASAVCALSNFPGSDIMAASATNLYKINPVGTITDMLAHGLGNVPGKYGMATNGQIGFVTTTAAGTVGVRKLTASGVYSTFSATPADCLEILNNTLYGLNRDNSNARLLRYDTAGTATSVFDWKSPDGTILTFGPGRIRAYGGKLLISMAVGGETNASELWIYDGTAPSKLEVFPPNFVATEIQILYGVAYIAGLFTQTASSTTSNTQAAILFFDGSQLGLLWKANSFSSSTFNSANLSITGPWPGLAVFDGNLVWNDDYNAQLLKYDPATGGVSSFGTYTVAGDTPLLHGTLTHLLHTRNQTTSYLFPGTTYPASGYVISSLIDFDSSLAKQFRGVKVEWSAASDGDGGSVDIAYQVDSLTGSWTTLKTGAVSGTEYTFSSISGHAIAVRVTINKGTSTAGPTLKSCSVRGAPVLTSYRINEYILDLGGDSSGQNPVMLRDNMTYHPLSGEQMHTNLAAAIQSQTPITVTDRSGTFTAMLEPSNCEFDLTRPGQWYARIHVREV